jgi:hypothetical protein
MTSRRLTCLLAAAAGGLFGVVLLSDALAVADNVDIGALADVFDATSYTLDPAGPQSVTGLYNIFTAPPGVNGSIQGYGQFDVIGNNSDDPVGNFHAYVSTVPYLGTRTDLANEQIATSQVLYVSPDVPGYEDPTGIAPIAGSVISTTHSFGGLFSNVYSAVPSGDSTTITDILKTPFGNIDLSQLVNALSIDAVNLPSVLPNGITATSDPVITAVSGLPPFTIDHQGYQSFQYGENPDATFNALETTTTDGVGFHTEAFLVTEQTGTADSLPIGSVYNSIDFYNLSNVYSSIPQPDGTDEVTDILIDTNTGQSLDLSPIFFPYDSSAGLDDGSLLRPISFGDDIIKAAPDAQLTYTGINGLPPGNFSIQGVGLFGVYDGGADTPSSTFEADVTTLQPMFVSSYTETLLVTDSADPALPEGSIIDFTSGVLGNENFYTDLPGLGPDGQNLITDTFVTPFGNLDLSWVYASLDASAGLTPAEGLASFADQPWLDLFDTVFGL